MFGGFGLISTGNYGNLNDVWKYNTSEGKWSWIKGKNNNETPEFSAGVGISDSDNQPIGGRDYTSWNDLDGNLWFITSNGALWKFDNENWIQMTENSNLNYGLIGSYHQNNSPGVRHNANAWIEENGSLLLFGGSEGFYLGPDENYKYNDLWRFDINLNQWAWIGGEKHIGNSTDNKYGKYGVLNEPFLTNLPGVRQKPMYWQDNDKNYYLYGGNGLGENEGGYLSDVWKLNRTFNVISGEIKIDVNNDGCQNTNLKMPYARINVTNSGPYIIFSNMNGAYIEANQLNDFSLVPEASYYSFEPASADFSFESVGNSLNQNFCAVGNGSINDLNIAIIPLTDPTPGNVHKYKIIYQNVGTTILSGNIQLNFQDNYMNFTGAVPNASSQAENMISWTYENLQPYQTKEIEFNMEFNTPTNSEFPLNGDEELVFEAVINPLDTDQTPDDNSFSLTQIVVNSFDPNDKTCLQGESILVDEIGDYVYYKIRFENTGTANASHIVITDFIDSEKFEISSLLPVDSSHDFSMSISDGNILRFNFEYINLPYPPSQLRFGYVVFKIRTKSSLQEGDVFANTANIYFDYNYPIITNDYQTVIESEMDTSEFFNNDISLYPNPTQGILNVTSTSPVSKVEIFDTSGRLILVLNNTSNKINISDLPSGIYIFKLHGVESTSNFRIIKK